MKALICEGGGMRGVFPAGVLDGFLQEGFDPFNLYFGVSAGCCNLSSQLAGQQGRNIRCYTDQMLRPEFLSFWRFLKGGSWMDIDWLWDVFDKEDPLDLDAALKNLEENNKKFFCTLTAVDNAELVLMQPDRDNWLDVLKAACAIPFMFRRFIEIGGREYTDGGIVNPIPAKSAYDMGARKIMVLRSQPPQYRKKSGLEGIALKWKYGHNKLLCDAMMKRPQLYNEHVGWITNPPEDAEVVCVYPPEDMRTKRTTQNKEDLRYDYQKGLEFGRELAGKMDW